MKIATHDARRHGELAELRFQLICRQLDLVLCRPISELSRWDFALELPKTKSLSSRASAAHVACHPERDAFSFVERRIWASDRASRRFSESAGLNARRELPHFDAFSGANLRLIRHLHSLNMIRIQVKSTAFVQYGAYRINLIWGADSRPYGPGDFDLLAAYIHPRDLWYLIPAAAFAPVRQILLSPDGLPHYERWEVWRERWNLLFPVVDPTRTNRMHRPDSCNITRNDDRRE
jgi:hypothetical protein